MPLLPTVALFASAAFAAPVPPELWDKAVCSFEQAVAYDAVVLAGAARCPAPAAPVDEQAAAKRREKLSNVLPRLRALQAGRLAGEGDDVVKRKVALVGGLLEVTDAARLDEIAARYLRLPPTTAPPTPDQLALSRAATGAPSSGPRLTGTERAALNRGAAELEAWRNPLLPEGLDVAGTPGTPEARSQDAAIRDYLASGRPLLASAGPIKDVPAAAAPPAIAAPSRSLWERIGGYTDVAKNFFSFGQEAPINDTLMMIQSRNSPLAAGKSVVDDPAQLQARLADVADGGLDHLTLQGHGIPGKMLISDNKKGMTELTVDRGRIVLVTDGKPKDITALLLKKVPPGGTVELLACNSAYSEQSINLAAEVSRLLPGRTVTGFAGKSGVNMRGREKVATWGYKNTCRDGKCDGVGTGLVKLFGGADNGIVTQIALFDPVNGTREALFNKNQPQ